MQAERVSDEKAGGGRQADDVFLPARRVLERYSVSDMSVWRWMHDPAVGFPRPLYIGRRRFWLLSTLVEWERARAAAGSEGGSIA